jgi:hypothetical protein
MVLVLLWLFSRPRHFIETKRKASQAIDQKRLSG